MIAARWLSSGSTLAALVALVACSVDEGPVSATGGAAGATSASGGSNASGGASGALTGGSAGASNPSTGGTLSTGGSSGGLSNTGGVPGSSGAAATSGAGGSVTGGSSSNGGTVASGGAQTTTGGTSSGGASGGAKATGGASSTGGGGAKATGGAATTGGASTGGAATTGGTSTGGAGGGAVPYKGVANSACADLTKLNASWWYNWTLSPGSCKAGEFVPMISGKNEKTTTAVTNAITSVGNGGYKTVLGFNEPNKTDQSNLTVAQVLSLWPSLTANANIRVGSPATSADAQAWFNDFMTQVAAQSLRVDFIAVHWYGWNAGSCDAKAASLESYLKWAEGIPGNRPIWITEWGCMNLSNPDAATVEAFFSGAITMLAKHPRVERYAWYPWNTNNELVKTDGSLTPLGTLFANAPATK